MAYEIERRFLVNITQVENLVKYNVPYKHIIQGYLSCEEATVRARLEDDKGYLVIKGPKVGMTCLEFDYEIPFDDAKQILKMSRGASVIKKRYTLPHRGHTWEIDIFEGANTGLFIAEIELDSEDEKFHLPKWIDKEITDDPRYSNYNLSIKPFMFWK